MGRIKKSVSLVFFSVMLSGLAGCMSGPAESVIDKSGLHKPRQGLRPSSDVPDLGSPRLTDVGDRHVEIKWSFALQSGDLLEVHVQRESDLFVADWSEIAVIEPDEEAFLHGPVDGTLFYRFRLIRSGYLSDWSEESMISVGCVDDCDYTTPSEDPADTDFDFDDSDEPLGPPAESPDDTDSFDHSDAVDEDEDDDDFDFEFDLNDDLLPEEDDTSDDDNEPDQVERRKPNRPENLRASVSAAGNIVLRWSHSGGNANHFLLERKKRKQDRTWTSWSSRPQVAGSSRSTTDSPEHRAVFKYRVRAVDGAASQWSASVSVVHLPPAKPDRVSAERGNGGKARLAWRHNGERVQQFVIERIHKRNNGQWSNSPQVFSVNRNRSHFVDTPNQARIYKYRIRAEGRSGTSSGSSYQRLDLR